MLAFFFWVTFIWVFIAVFADIFSRHDIGGLAKAGWIAMCCILPFVGVLVYMIARPRPTVGEVREFELASRGYASGVSAADELGKLAKLQEEGKISTDEYEKLKAKTLAA